MAFLAYLVVAAMILSDPGSRIAMPTQLAVTAVAVAGLVLLCALLASLVMEAFPPTWIGLGTSAGAVTMLGLMLLRAPRRPGWTIRHVAAGGLGLLLGRGLLTFTTTPLAGEVGQTAKLGHNVVMLGVVLLADAVAIRSRGVRRRR